MYEGLLHPDTCFRIIQSQITYCRHLAGSGLGLCYMTSASVPLLSQQAKTWDGFKGILKDNPSAYTNTANTHSNKYILHLKQHQSQNQVRLWFNTTYRCSVCSDERRKHNRFRRTDAAHGFFTAQRHILAKSHDFLCSWRHVDCRFWFTSSLIHDIPSPLYHTQVFFS